MRGCVCVLLPRDDSVNDDDDDERTGAVRSVRATLIRLFNVHLGTVFFARVCEVPEETRRWRVGSSVDSTKREGYKERERERQTAQPGRPVRGIERANATRRKRAAETEIESVCV